MAKAKSARACASGKAASRADKTAKAEKPARTETPGLTPIARNDGVAEASRERRARNTDISELARKYAARAIERVAEIMESDNNREALAAAFHLLDRAFPKNAGGSDDKNSTNEVMLGLRESLRAKLARLTE